MKNRRQTSVERKPTRHSDDAELEGLVLDLVDLGRRRDQADRYARTLERLLVDKGLVKEDLLESITAEAHAQAAIETALNPIFDEVIRNMKRVIRKERRHRP